MARKDKNYVFKDSNEDQRKVKVSKRVIDEEKSHRRTKASSI